MRDIDAVEVSEAAASMTGPQLQTPPMVSALKVDGRRLHELARAGIEVERAPRHITVERFDVTATTDPLQWDFDVTCSVGTYVRVLASDLAQRLRRGRLHQTAPLRLRLSRALTHGWHWASRRGRR